MATAEISPNSCVAAFIKPLPGHWRPEDLAPSRSALPEPVRHIARTICLLESRCDDYAAYLRAIVLRRGGGWVAGIDVWNAEECQHGELLRRLCESDDPAFPFDDLMGRYTRLVSYHPADGQSVRGSMGGELVSRCVVEALASTLYRVLADAADDEEVRRVFIALAQDEARHFGMFSRMLAAETERMGGLGRLARCGHALRRIAELEDSQIMVASAVVSGRDSGPISPHAEANRYLSGLYGLYQWQHLRYAARMLLMSVAIRPTRLNVVVCTTAMWVGLKTRWAWARLSTSRPRAARQVAEPVAAPERGRKAGPGR